MKNIIPFNVPYMTHKELAYISQAHINKHLSGNGPFTKKCESVIEKTSGTLKALLTHSCTAALEMAAILLDIQHGDEIIMPSFTFVSTANAFVLRGGIPVFIDIKPDTLNMDELLIEKAITHKTKAIVCVHYAGVSCEMDVICKIAQKYNLYVVEDAAQGICARYKNKALGSIGHLGTYSFHETKNIISGEGGCLLINDTQFCNRAEIIREKGTDRTDFFKGKIDKYTWRDIGSSFLVGEISAAFLYAQLEQMKNLIKMRLEVWNYYHKLLNPLEKLGFLTRPKIPANSTNTAHMYYIILASHINAANVLKILQNKGIYAVSHYIPLHSSPAGLKYGRANGNLSVTDQTSKQLIRLPLWVGLTKFQQKYIVKELYDLIKTKGLSYSQLSKHTVMPMDANPRI